MSTTLLDRFSSLTIKRFLQLCFFGHLVAFVGVHTRLGAFDWLGHLHGRDFLQFYTAGKIVLDGEATRLYDQDHFIAVEEGVINSEKEWPRYYSLYPPAVGLLASPFALVGFPMAVLLWWAILVGLFALATNELARNVIHAERSLVWWGMFSFQPVVTTFWDGQLSAVWLVAIIFGFTSQSEKRKVKAGLILSLLALKPQLGIGIGVWLILQKDWKTLFWMFVGSLLQQGVVFVILGSGVVQGYFANLEIYSKLQGLYFFDPSYQHSVSGILIDKLGPDFRWSARLIHLGMILIVTGLSYLIIKRTKDFGIRASLGCLLAIVFAPHLLLYDLVLLAPAIVLLTQQAKRPPSLMVVVLGLYLSGMLAFGYQVIGVSLVPVAIVCVVAVLAKQTQPNTR